tara:strand:- start:530 stop:715 length:186 start_codon:yes stop_codon:yes gene_type:complete
MKRTLKQRQELCTDLLHAILESSDDGDLSLLEYVIDEYIYRLNNTELDELEDVMVNHFGEE